MQFFVAIIDNELFEQIVFMIFKTEKIQNTQMFAMYGAMLTLRKRKFRNY